MNTIECPGLDGSNPLHFLASLGVMRLSSRNDSFIKMGWNAKQGYWHPWFSMRENFGKDELARQLFEWIRELGKTSISDPSLKRRAADLSTQIKKDEGRRKTMNKNRKAIQRSKKDDTLADEFECQFSQLEHEILNKKDQLAEFQIQIGGSLGPGIAHIGDVIGVNPDLFRYKANDALDRLFSGNTGNVASTSDAELVASSLASLACDQISEDGKLAYTPFSFSNGGSGQCLLKDFRDCAKATTLTHINGTLFEVPKYETSLSSLGWDPSDQSLYAMQWHAPEVVNKKGVKRVDPAVQTLAYVGLSMLPAVPIKGDLTAIGWTNDGKKRCFNWPIWDIAIPFDIVESILAYDSRSVQKLPGVVAGFSVTVQNPNGKRNFFSPSRSI